MSHPKAVCLVVANDKDQILSVSRKNDPTQFAFPGGKVEEGESLREALSREVEEETGYHIEPDLLTLMLSDVVPGEATYETFAFVCDEKDLGTQKAPKENLNIRWSDGKDLCKGLFAEYNKTTLGIFYSFFR